MIIIIDGSINSGKTTVSGLIASMVPNTAHVEVDSLRHFVHWLPLEEAIPISLENAASVALNLVARGMHVVIDYPLGAEDHQYLVDRLAKTAEMVHTFTLSPSLSVAVENRGNRELSARAKRRIREQYEYRKSHSPVGLPIDNTHQTPEETAETIVKELGLR